MAAANVPFNAMPPASAELDTMWAFLEEGVNHIMTKGRIGVGYEKYLSLYTVAYNYCTPPRMQEDSSESAGAVSQTMLAYSMCSELYDNLTRYLVAHLKGLRDNTDALPEGEALLRYYAEEWDRYTIGANYLDRLFTCLNRHWVKPERDQGRMGVYSVYTLALVQWKNNLFIPMQQERTNLVTAILRLIEAQRNGDAIDEGLVKNVVDSFVSLGIDDSNINKECLDIYKEHFELPFIDATERYYKQESESFLAARNLSNYLKKVEERLWEEEERVKWYLNTQTRKPLISKCEEVLIREHSDKMWESFQSLLDLDKDEGLQKMYSLLSRIPEGLEPLYKKFGEHVKKAGLVAVSKLVGESSGNIDVLDSRAYVDALLDVHKKNSETIARSFRGDAGFVASLDKGFREFVNRNAATDASNSKSPEIIAKYADLILRRNNKLVEESDLEGALNRVMILIKYIEDKDVFHTLYASKLSKRLIHGVSASEESEAAMISNLKNACGFEYVNKLQRMFSDMIFSKDLTDQFNSQMEQNHDGVDISFTIMVLGANFWPLHPPPHDFLIPTEILPTYDRFQNYYRRKHSCRKLTWLWNYSKNELQTNYLNQKYILMTSTFQMAILLQYNKNDTLSLSELSAATSITKDRLVRLLEILVKAKILVNKETEKYHLNPGFESKKIRVNLNLPLKAAAGTESTGGLKAVDENRKYIIRNMILRIIKPPRRKIKNQALIIEVISQISDSETFAPRIPDIKTAIDSLLEDEYIERVDGTRDMFAYVRH